MSVRWKVSAWKVVSASAFLLLSVGLYLAAPTQGATWDVYEGDCIQDAVDSAGYGDTVLVHLGEYHQSVEFGDEDDGITLQGDGAVLDGTGSADPECDKFVDAIILHGGVEDVTIEGFEIRDYAAGAGEGEGNGVVAWDVGVDASTDDITVRNNKMHDLHWNGVLVGSDGTAYGGEGLHEDWLIEGNTIWDTGAYGVECSNCDDSVIRYNIITIGDTRETTGDWGGILVAARQEGTTEFISNDIDVLNNKVTSGVDDDEYDPIGIVLEACNPDPTICDEVGGTAELSEVLVDGNILTAPGSGRLAAGVLVVEYAHGNMALITISDSVISGADGENDIPDDGPNVDGYGIYLKDVTDDFASIKGNAVTGSGTTDIRLEASGAAEVTDNVASGSTYVIEVLNSDGVEVEGNTVSGATYGVWVSGDSDSTSITDNVITGNAQGVRLDSAGTGTSISFNTIDDNTDYGVNVTNTDSVTIDKNGVHDGNYSIWIEDSDSVVITDNTVTLFGKRGITAVDSGAVAPVNTKGNTVNSSATGTTDPTGWPRCPETEPSGIVRMSGIYYASSKGMISENDIPGVVHVGILVCKGSDVDVLNNHVSDYHKNGINVALAPASAGDPVLIQGNTIVGTAPSPAIARNGIVVGAGADAQVLDNSVSGNWYSGDVWTSTGILVFEGSNIEVNGNRVTTSQTGIGIETWCSGLGGVYASASGNSITGNRISGAERGVSVGSIADTSNLGTECDPEANDNIVDGNVITGPAGETGIDVFALDDSGGFAPQTANTLVRNNLVTGYGVGVREEATDWGEVTGNVVRGNGDGIVASDTSNLEIDGNVVSGNTGDGIKSLGGNTELLISRNTVRDNARGIVLEDDETAERNVVSGNTGEGILVLGVGNEVFRNVVRNNEWGIVVEGGSNTVSRNTVNTNDVYGIWAKVGADSNMFSRNVALANTTCDLKDDGSGNSWILNVYGCWDPP